MLTIRNYLDTRSLTMLIIVVLLCAATLAYAIAWYTYIWGAVTVITTTYTLIDMINDAMKTIDEKIAEIEDVDIPDLEKKFDAADTKHAFWKGVYDSKEEAYEKRKQEYSDAQTAVETAETALKAAEIALPGAKSAYDTSVRYENDAYLKWYNHKQGCSRPYCSVREQLFSDWKHYEGELAQDKKDYEAAKAAIPAAKKDLKSKQWARIDALEMYNIIKRRRKMNKVHMDDYADKRYDIGIEILFKEGELTVLNGKRTRKDTEKRELSDKVGKRIGDLMNMKESDPDKWNETLDSDDELRREVEKIMGVE